MIEEYDLENTNDNINELEDKIIFLESALNYFLQINMIVLFNSYLTKIYFKKMKCINSKLIRNKRGF